MRVNLLVVGDEILSGKRKDQHLSKVIELLRARGMELAEARFVSDDEAQIAESVRQLHADNAVVLSCGGIGATPDDRTRQAVARAFGVPIVRHAEAEALIVAQYQARAYPNRVIMAEFPAGASVIPNPVNRVAGFSIHRVYCVPGFPEMAWPMLEWVLDGPLRHLHFAAPRIELRLRATGSAAESELLELMQGILSDYPGIALSSLPSRGEVGQPAHIEFGIKAPAPLASAAFDEFRRRLEKYPGVSIIELEPR